MKNIIVNVSERGSSYVRQIVTGFTLLQKEGKLNVGFHEKKELKSRTNHQVEILVDGKRIVCDLTDGYNNFTSFRAMDELLDEVDVFFKACSKQEFNSCLRNGYKIKTLPPRYAATIAGAWNEKIDWRFTRGTRLLKDLLWRIPGTKHAISDYYYDRFECSPIIRNPEPKVFFYTRLWDPAIASYRSSQNEDIDGKTVEERIMQKKQEFSALSEMRAGLVKALKKEFGSRFVGGIAPDEYTQRVYHDLLGPDLSQRRSYTRAMHSAEICVNTWGTHKCFNFSFGEELAASRAIVTQKAFYDLPEHLQEGENFVSFSTIDQAVDEVAKMLDDRTKVEEMMVANNGYYTDFLRPERYVLTILENAGVLG